jgi:lipoate synthase
LNNKINKKSTPVLLEKYAKDVENLIVELNRAVEDVLNLSEERIEELKKVIKQAEKLLNNPKVKKSISLVQKEGEAIEKRLKHAQSNNNEKKNLLEKTNHLLSMGHTKEEIAQILNINNAEVDFLESLNKH